MLYIDKDTEVPIYEQIYTALRQEILSGSLRAGDRLIATRRLAAELSLGRNTVDKAYQQLVAEGYVDAVQGSGFIVNRIPPALLPGEEAGSCRSLPQEREGEQPKYNFAYGIVDNSTFPWSQWRKSVNNAMVSMEIPSGTRYPEQYGEYSLRAEIARYLYRSRGVRCDASQVIVTCGHQHSMEVLANVFADSKKRFAVEDPGYDGIRAVFKNHNYRLYPIPVERDGVILDAVLPLAEALLYLTPSHQFPTGAVLSIAKRRELLQWAEDKDSYLIEDDYDSELRYETDPIPSLQSLDVQGRVIYTGTFSKALSPSMRTAYIVLPHALRERFTNYYDRYNAQVSPLIQNALADFMAEGNFEKHINRLRIFYRKKQNVLLAAISDLFGSTAVVSGAGAGIHILIDLDTELTAEELVERADAIGIRVYSTRENYIDPGHCPRSQILLGFATLPEERCADILKELRAAWEMEPGKRKKS